MNSLEICVLRHKFTNSECKAFSASGIEQNRPTCMTELYTSLSANTIMAELTNQFQQTRFIISLPDKHYSLDSEDDFRSSCRNVSRQQQFFQNYPHLDDHTIHVQTTDTPGFKPFTICFLYTLTFPSNFIVQIVFPFLLTKHTLKQI